MKDWHLVEDNPVRWLVEGLLPADGFSAAIGKPKAGKSTLIRQLIASTILSLHFLGRRVNIPKGSGRVLYIHLDRKDKPSRVAAELRQLGITGEDDVSRLALMVADDLPVMAPGENPAISFANRLDWLQREVLRTRPHLIIIDLLQQFVCVSNVNDYAESLTSVNQLQDALTSIGYDGGLLATLHTRKATNIDQPFDDTLGSTAFRGSFTTLILLKQNRAEGRYTIMSDQTEREDPWGEIDETELIREPDGVLSLGRPVTALKDDTRTAKMEADIERVYCFIKDNPGCETDRIIASLAIAKARFLEIVAKIRGMLSISGQGTKGDPKRYSVGSFELPTPGKDAPPGMHVPRKLPNESTVDPNMMITCGQDGVQGTAKPIPETVPWEPPPTRPPGITMFCPGVLRDRERGCYIDPVTSEPLHDDEFRRRFENACRGEQR
jgi:hypothetical protein